MNEAIRIRGKEYKVYPFSDLHLASLTTLLMNISSMNFDLTAQAQAGSVLKEIILQDLPPEIVLKSGEDKYYLLLDIEEVVLVNEQLAEIYLQRKIKEAEANNDIDKQKEYQSRLKAIKNKELLGGDQNTESLLAEIQKLQSQLEAKSI
jgi:hypothetical protein